MKFLGVFRWANLIVVILTLLSYLSPFLDPGQYWPVALLGLFYPWLLLINVLFILFWGLQKDKYLFFSLLCIFLGWGHLKGFLGLNPSGWMPKSAIRVTTFNCHGFFFVNKDRQKNYVPATAVAELVDAEGQIDILCLQEFATSRSRHKDYQEAIAKKSGMEYFYQEDGGLAVFSRYPIVSQESVYFPNRTNGYQVVDLDADGDTVRLFNVHLQSNAVTGLAGRVAENGSIQDTETWLTLRGMASRYRTAAAMRTRQAEEIAARIQESPHPVILCGDFNDVPLSHVYHRLSHGMRDAFKTRGFGLGTTYVGDVPALRIDYVLASRGLRITGFRTGRNDFSDHRQVSASLELR